MNRRKFLGWLAGLIPAAAAAWWWRQRQTVLPHASPGRSSGTVHATTAHVRGSAPSGSSADDIRYVAGLPLRTADPATLAEPCRSALRVSHELIMQHCTDLSFGNGAIHGVRALGRGISFGGGDPFRVLLERYTQEKYVQGRVVLEVPVRQEGHTNAMLKTLIEKQCELDLEFEHEGRPYRFRDYVESARLLFDSDPSQRIDEKSWTLMALARITPARQTGWTNLYGHPVDLGTLVDQTSQVVFEDTQLVRSVDLDLPELPRTCPAFGRVCGGLHMVYAIAVALSCGHTNDRRRREFAVHMQTLVRRFRYDLEVIAQVEKLNIDLVGSGRAAVTAFDARSKFLGHAFEIVGVVQQFDLYEFSAAEREQVEAAREALCQLLSRSDTVDWARIRADRQLYESVVGGICHAYNGLLMSAV